MPRYLTGLAAAAFFAMTPLPGSAAPAECPTRDGDQKLELLEHAPTCAQALALFQACSYGASGDVGLGEVVTRKCEGDFLSQLSKAQRRGYDRQQKQCESRYQNRSGTMYRSFEAFCTAKLAEKYSQRFAGGSKP